MLSWICWHCFRGIETQYFSISTNQKLISWERVANSLKFDNYLLKFSFFLLAVMYLWLNKNITSLNLTIPKIPNLRGKWKYWNIFIPHLTFWTMPLAFIPIYCINSWFLIQTDSWQHRHICAGNFEQCSVYCSLWVYCWKSLDHCYFKKTWWRCLSFLNAERC